MPGGNQALNLCNFSSNSGVFASEMKALLYIKVLPHPLSKQFLRKLNEDFIALLGGFGHGETFFQQRKAPPASCHNT